MLEAVCFILFASLTAIYLIADGFDLGVGTLSLFLRDTRDKAAAAYALWPIWNGNEVWLLSAVVLLMAAFSPVYAAILSSFYIPAILLAAAIIFRGISLEFYDKVTNAFLKNTLFLFFGIGSAFIAFAVGFVAGNVMRGIPFESGSFTILPALIDPFSLFMGSSTLFYCALHGAVFLGYKQHGKARAFFMPAFIAFIASAAGATLSGTLTTSLGTALGKPLVFPAVGLCMAALTSLFFASRRGHTRTAFVLSSLLGIGAVISCAAIMFPNMLATPGRMLTAYSAASSNLPVIIAITITGIPLAICFNILSYWVFRTVRKKQ
ncbi:MAG: cytochrome d ubiquinol oxidase subunit II [Spirochaetota bacterium]